MDKPKRLTGIVEADETFILESFKGRRSGLPRQPRKRGGKAKHPGPFFENIPILVARDREGATVDAVLPNVDRASIAAALEGLVTPANRFVCDGGKAIVAFVARRANIPVHVVPAPGKPRPEAPEIHINNVNAYHGQLKEWMRRFHGVATKNLPNYLGDGPWKHGETKPARKTGSSAPSAWDHINSKRYKRVTCRSLVPSSLSDLNVKSLISLEFVFLARKIKLNDINMLSVKRTSSPTDC